MAYRIELTTRAETDAYAAYDYIRQLSPDGADKWLKGLFAAIFSLDELPARCPLVSEAEEIGLPIRHHLFGRRTGTYRIIFDIQEQSQEGPAVRVLRIWHASRDRLSASDIVADE